MLPDKYGIHEKTVEKAHGSYDVVIGRFLCFAYTIIVEIIVVGRLLLKDYISVSF